ncbi:hypothetical protein D3C72_2042340 [compost metagenome]
MAALAHHAGEQAGEVARAGADVGDALARLELGEGEHFSGVTQGVAGDLVGGAQGVRDGALIGGGLCGLSQNRRGGGDQQGRQGGGEQAGLHKTTSETAGPHKARVGSRWQAAPDSRISRPSLTATASPSA